MPKPTANPFPCTECGYDLRAATGEVCPECGCEITRRTYSRSSVEQDQSATAVEAFGETRKGVDWTLVVWLGCVAVPIVGQLAWVVLALVSGWRTLALRRLLKTQFLEGFKQHKFIAAWPSTMNAELGVALFGGLFTIVGSMNEMHPVVIAMLVLVRIAWLGLVSINNFSAATLALASSAKLGGDPPHPSFRYIHLAIFGAPILATPYFLLGVIDNVVKVPGWISTPLILFFVIACIFGIAGVIMIHTALEQASDALVESQRRHSRKAKRNGAGSGESSNQAAKPNFKPNFKPNSKPYSKQEIFPDPPPADGDGDVIPFEDDSPGPSRS